MNDLILHVSHLTFHAADPKSLAVRGYSHPVRDFVLFVHCQRALKPAKESLR